MKTAILFELHHLGDAVLAIPFVRAMHREGGHTLHVVCRAGSVEIFRKYLPINQIHAWEPWWEQCGVKKIHSLRRWFDLRNRLRNLQAAKAFCVWADSRVHWLMRQIGAGQRIGFPVNRQNFYAHERPWRHRRMRLGQIIGLFAKLNLPLQRRDYQQPHLTDWEQLTEAADLNWDASTPWFDVTPAQFGVSDSPLRGKRWLIHPGGRLLTKRWPIQRFQELLRTRFRENTMILIEPPDSPPLVSEFPHHSSLKPASLDELLGLIAGADAVLCNDSLVSHFAAALGKPVWTIFGSANLNWFAPFENRERVIVRDVCPLRPCIDRCPFPTPICLEAVSTKDVEDKIRLAGF